MSTYLRKLSDIGTPDLVKLTKNDSVNEIISRIQADPRWNEMWDGELLQNDAYMIINLFAYLFDKDIQYTNRVVREAIPTLARDPNNIINGMAIRNVGIKQAEGAEAIVELLIPDNFLNATLVIPAGTSIQARNLDSNNIPFELWNVLPSYSSPMSNYGDNQKIDYFSDLVIPAGENSIEAHAFAGTTKVEAIELQLNSSENFIVKLQNSDIINSSLRVYYSNDGGLTLKELNRADTFSIKLDLSDAEFPEGKPVFIPKFNSTGGANIVFGSKEFGGYFPNPIGKTIYVYYRVGGGIKTNINANGINSTLEIATVGGRNVAVSVFNRYGAGGGQDRENINVTQNIGPLRYGRGETINQAEDAMLALTGIALKHKVDTPKYSETNNKVQLLHYHNYIVPQRTFSNFIAALPIPEEFDNMNSYYENKFLKTLNEYLNLTGLKDGKIENEFVKTFDSLLFSTYQLYSDGILNGSLELNAFDENNKLIDRLYFKRNYDGSLISSTPFAAKAVISSTQEIGNIVVGNTNRMLRIQIDEDNPIVDLEIVGINTSLAFSALFGRLNYDIANRINEVIKTNDVYESYFAGFDPNHKFCFIDDNTGILSIQSPSTGFKSMVKIYDSPNSIIETIKILPTANKAFPDSGRVFNESTSFNSANNVINININENLVEQVIDSIDVLSWPDPNEPTGPSIVKTFIDFDEITPIKVELGIGAIIIQATNTPLDVNGNLPDVIDVVDEIRFDITENTGVFTASNTGTSPFFGTVFDLGDERTNYDYDSGRLLFSLIDDNGSSIGKFASYNTVDPFILNVNNVDGLKVGMEVIGDDILGGATISSIDETLLKVEINLPVSVNSVGSTIEFISPPYDFTNTFLGASGGYNKNTKFRIQYRKKIYETLTVNYLPNPYLQNAEAGMIMKYLRADDKNMISMVPLIKRVRFVPFKIKGTVEVLPGKSLREAELNTKNTISRFFSFASSESTQNIGVLIPAPFVQSVLSDSRYNPGVAKVSIIEPANILNLIPNEYSFVFDDDVINELLEFERKYTQIEGMTEAYLKNELVFKFIK